MDILISIEDPQEAWSFLQSVRAKPGISRIQVLTDAPVEPPAAEPAPKASFFERHYGSIPNLDVAAFEAYLAETRRGWEEREAAHDRIRANPTDNPYQP